MYKNDDIYYNYKKELRLNMGGCLIYKIHYNGEISIYQFDDIQIIVPKNQKINIIPKITLFSHNDHWHEYRFYDLQLILYLFSFSYKNYLEIQEHIIIKLKFLLDVYDYSPIYKNGKYIIKWHFSNRFLQEKIIKEFNLHHIYEILLLNGSNIYYGNKEKISIIKNICYYNDINYEIGKNYIKMFIVDGDLKFVKYKYFEGEIYIFNNYYSIPTKIGKYILFI